MFSRTLISIAGVLCLALSAPLYAKGTTLSDVEVADLMFMREEEKLAHDVYVELYEHYKAQGIELIILANIAGSEQRHMDAMLRLLNKFRLDDPAADLGPGEFDNPVFTALYENLVSDSDANTPILNEPSSGGKVSPEAALYVGAWIEERDMIDILQAIANTGNARIVGVYTNLLCGSRAHLRGFVARLGVDSYEPQILYSADDVGSEVDPVETLEYWLGSDSDEICN